MEKFIVARTYCAQDYNADLDLAVIQVTPELIADLEKWAALMQPLIDTSEFWAAEFWDSTPEYYGDDGSLESKLTSEEWEHIETHGWVAIDADPTYLDGSEVSTACTLLSIGKDIFWTTQDKHSGVEVKTETFTLSQLKAILEVTDKHYLHSGFGDTINAA